MPSAAILAGGQATRFGGLDKGAALVHGRSILDRQLAALTQVTDDILYVGANPSAEYRGRLRAVADLLPGLGPLGGLDAALGAARDDTVVVVAGDMPLLTGPFLLFLASLADTERHVDAVVPRTAHGMHPLAAVYRKACRPRIQAVLAGDERAMRALLETLHVREVGIDELARFGNPDLLLANVNTPADLDQVQSLAGHTR
jgi:molybdopterin-guanine dinucleotide biosynthesis protein A